MTQPADGHPDDEAFVPIPESDNHHNRSSHTLRRDLRRLRPPPGRVARGPPGGIEVALGTPVLVTGTVHQAFDLRRLDAVPDDRDQRTYETYRGEPYINATSLEPLPQ